MAGLYRDRGVVLRSVKLGEADRIVTFLTEGRGKVRAVAKGIRKPKSRFGARLEPTVHLAVQLYEGRNLDVVTQVETIDANRSLREHYGAYTQAIAMLEAADQVAREGGADVALYRLLSGALRTLAGSPHPAVATGFFWKLLGIEGVAPMLDTCVRCGGRRGNAAASFEVAEGGVLCRGCGGPFSASAAGGPFSASAAGGGAPAVTAAALALVERITGGGLAGVLAEAPGPALAEATSLALRCLEHHTERRLRSTPILHAAGSIPGHVPR